MGLMEGVLGAMRTLAETATKHEIRIDQLEGRA